jgi:hypothetical protein
MIVTPIRTTYKPVDAVRSDREEQGSPRSFADLMGLQARAKANDNPAVAVTRNVPSGAAVNGQFFDLLA